MKRIWMDDVRKKNFIIYNHIYMNKGYRFTISSLTDEIRKYDDNISQEDVLEEVNRFIQLGIVQKNFGDYSVCPR